MTDEMQSIRDDIAYLKAMADSGRDGAITGGWTLVAAGGLYGAASLVHWATLSGFGGLPPSTSSWGWLAALLGFFLVLFLTKRRGGADSRPRAIAQAWQGIGWGIFFMFAAIALATWRTSSPILISFSPAIVLGLYGVAWWVAAAVTGKRWLVATAAGSFAASLISAWLVTDTAQWLFYAIALVMLALVPGLVVLREARARGE
jgi:hypothetical protein